MGVVWWVAFFHTFVYKLQKWYKRFVYPGQNHHPGNLNAMHDSKFSKTKAFTLKEAN